MAENRPQEYRQLNREELETLAGEELPEQAAMSLIDANIAIPVDPAIAANVLSAPPATTTEPEGTTTEPTTTDGSTNTEGSTTTP